MKFQDDISNMNTYIRTYIHTDKPKPICPLLFQNWGHNYDGLESLMPHTKFRGNRLAGSGEEDF